MKNKSIMRFLAVIAVIICGIWYSNYHSYSELTFANSQKIYYDNIEEIELFTLAQNEKAIVNINTAGLEELMTLKGIGEKTAQEIIDYRNENGFFEDAHDITNVSGIGEKTFESIKDDITVKNEE